MTFLSRLQSAACAFGAAALGLAAGSGSVFALRALGRSENDHGGNCCRPHGRHPQGGLPCRHPLKARTGVAHLLEVSRGHRLPHGNKVETAEKLADNALGLAAALSTEDRTPHKLCVFGRSASAF